MDGTARIPKFSSAYQLGLPICTTNPAIMVMAKYSPFAYPSHLHLIGIMKNSRNCTSGNNAAKAKNNDIFRYMVP